MGDLDQLKGDIKGDIIHGISWKFYDFTMKWDILPSGKQTVCELEAMAQSKVR